MSTLLTRSERAENLRLIFICAFGISVYVDVGQTNTGQQLFVIHSFKFGRLNNAPMSPALRNAAVQRRYRLQCCWWWLMGCAALVAVAAAAASAYETNVRDMRKWRLCFPSNVAPAERKRNRGFKRTEN
jgi:hypothetical protein